MSKCLINEFLKNIYIEKGLSDNTIISYKNDLKKAKEIINNKHLSDINENDRQRLRGVGFSDRDIWDIANVAGFFNIK